MSETERAISILELMAIDLTGILGGLSETNPLCDVVKQRIAAIDAAQDALREKSGRENRKTNADRIRSMNDEELARFLGDEPPYFSTYDKYLEWLQQPVEEEKDGGKI